MSKLNSISDVNPAPIAKRLSEYRPTWHPEHAHFIDEESGCQLGFDHQSDHPNQLLVYEQAGGGSAACHILSSLALCPEFANEVVRRLLTLGPDFDAVHIRHSDYETDFRAFLSKLRLVLKNRTVLICSDSPEAKNEAAVVLDPSTRLKSVSDLPDTNGVPLHYAENIDFKATNADMITDLMALSLADHLFFTKLSGGNANGVKYSGFSLLADQLHRNRSLVFGLLSQADPERLDQLIDTLQNAKIPRSSLLRKLLLLDVWRWNFGAKAKAFRRNRRAGSNVLNLEKIGPRYQQGNFTDDRNPG